MQERREYAKRGEDPSSIQAPSKLTCHGPHSSDRYKTGKLTLETIRG